MSTNNTLLELTMISLVQKSQNEIYNFIIDEDNLLILKALSKTGMDMLEVAVPNNLQRDYLIKKLQNVLVEVETTLNSREFLLAHVSHVCEQDEDGRDMVEDYTDEVYDNLSNANYYLYSFLNNCQKLAGYNYDFGFSQMLETLNVNI